MRVGFALLSALLLSSTALAEPTPELRLLSEHAVEGMRGGNLSGLAQCGEALWTISDRDDNQIYRLDTRQDAWQAEAVPIDVPIVPASGLPWGLSSRSWAASPARPGASRTCSSAVTTLHWSSSSVSVTLATVTDASWGGCPS